MRSVLAERFSIEHTTIQIEPVVGEDGHLDPKEIRDSLLAVAGVSSVHCLHVWTIGSSEVSLSSHLVTEPAREPERLLQDVRSVLAERFSIEHTTIQIEPVVGEDGEETACADACEPSGLPA